MFLDRLTKKTLNIIGVISATLATIMLILVIVVPILYKRKKKNDYIQKCNPSMDNTNIWASFPGDLNSKLLHNFGFFEYEEKKEKENSFKISLKTNIEIEEQVKYTNFTQVDSDIFFYNNRAYKETNKKEGQNNIPIKSINLGMFETLETMSFPPLYKLGINSIYYLSKKYFITSDLFIRELFAVNLTKSLSVEDIKDKILINLPEIFIELILYNENKEYKKYSLNNTSGFFEWIKILGSQEKINNSIWLYELFHLNEEQINSILLNEDCYLIQEFEKYNKFLIEKFKCENETKCGEELLYKQLIDSSVISYLFPDINNYLELNIYLNTDYYPFDISPEMKLYFINEYGKQKGHKTNYEDVSININQLKKFIQKNGEYYLLSLQNSINILHLNKTEDRKKNINYFDDLTYDNINFLTEYFYYYLPRIFLYPFENSKDNSLEKTEYLKSNGLMAKTVSNLLPKIVEKTFDKISKIDLHTHLMKKVVFSKLKKNLNIEELDEICPIIMQKILDDGKKVFQICSDENINLMDELSLFKYIQLYYCQKEIKDESKCDNSLYHYLKKAVYISDGEIFSLISKESHIGKAIEEFESEIKDKYECPGKCNNDYLLRIQYAKARITRDPPDPFEKANGLKDWFPELEDIYEIINIKEKYGNKEPFEENDVFLFVDAINRKGDIFDLDNSAVFHNKIKFEKKYYNGLMSIQEDNSSLVKLIYFLFGIYVFDIDNNKNNSLIVNYTSIDNFLQGISEENQYWINFLKDGNYFENFKPHLDHVTKFDFGFDFDKGKQTVLDLDYISISTKTSDYNKRRITKMNNLKTLNIKKEDYDITKDSNIKLPFPLYNLEKLLGDRIFSDGFQYDNSLEVIYYYDLISSRPLFFKNKETVKYKDKIECKKYVLDLEDLSAGINEYFDLNDKNAMLIQKVNKPFMIKVDYVEYLKKFGLDLKETNNNIENYICVDTISDMVIDSKMNFLYSINPRKYNLLNKNIEKDNIYPLFLYKRNYEIDVDSYSKQFPGVTEYYENATTFIVIGVIFIILFTAVAVVAFIYLKKRMKLEGDSEIGENIGNLEEGLTKRESKAESDN